MLEMRRDVVHRMNSSIYKKKRKGKERGRRSYSTNSICKKKAIYRRGRRSFSTNSIWKKKVIHLQPQSFFHVTAARPSDSSEWCCCHEMKDCLLMRGENDERENSTNKQSTIYCQVTVSHLRTLTHQGHKTEKDIWIQPLCDALSVSSCLSVCKHNLINIKVRNKQSWLNHVNTNHSIKQKRLYRKGEHERTKVRTRRNRKILFYHGSDSWRVWSVKFSQFWKELMLRNLSTR